MNTTRIKTTSKNKVRRKTKKGADLQVSPADVIEDLFSLFKDLGIDNLPLAFSRGTNLPKGTHTVTPRNIEVAELLTRWHQTLEYLDPLGLPSPLRILGSSPSFESLVQSCFASADVEEILLQLVRLGAVSIDTSNFVHAEMRSFPVYEDKTLAAQHTLTALDGFIRTLRHNLQSVTSNADQLFHRIVKNDQFSVTEIPALKVRIKRDGQRFLESFDDWLVRQSMKNQKQRVIQKKTQVAIGIYLSIQG